MISVLLFFFVSAATQTNASPIFSKNDLYAQVGEMLQAESGKAPQCGTSIALTLDGLALAVGCPYEANSIGSVRIYIRASLNDVWELFQTIFGQESYPSRFGFSVSLSDDGFTLATGGPSDNSNLGSAWTFGRKNVRENFQQIGSKLVGPDSFGIVEQGAAVKLSKNGLTLIVGGPEDQRTATWFSMGAVWVYTRANLEDKFSLLQPKINLQDLGYEQYGFGCSIDLSADALTLAVGADQQDIYRGCVFIYKRLSQNDAFFRFSKVFGTADGIVPQFAYQGGAVALSKDGLLLASGGFAYSPSPNYDLGAVWLFVRNSTESEFQQVGLGPLTPQPALDYTYFGWTMMFTENGKRLVIGAYGHSSGGVFIFDDTGNDWKQNGPKLIGLFNGEEIFGGQGKAVAFDQTGSALVVGAPWVRYAENGNEGAVWTFSENFN